MPKPFDERDKKAIRALLMKAGLARFSQQGIRATRLDDLCREAGIAKGSFYAFFPSKEELFMAIVDEREVFHRRDMLAFLEGWVGPKRACAESFFDMLVAKIAADPVLAIVMRNDEIPYLVRKLGPERMAKSEADDQVFVQRVAEVWPGGAVDAADLLGLMTLVLSLATNAPAMTPGQYQPTLELLRKMFVDRLTGGRND